MNNAYFKERLEQLQQDAEERLQRYDQHLRHEQGPVSPDFAEQATEVENDETISALREAVGHELSQIKAALQRMADDRYGLCLQCGAAVSTERLEVLPFATLCKHCAE